MHVHMCRSLRSPIDSSSPVLVVSCHFCGVPLLAHFIQITSWSIYRFFTCRSYRCVIIYVCVCIVSRSHTQIRPSLNTISIRKSQAKHRALYIAAAVTAAMCRHVYWFIDSVMINPAKQTISRWETRQYCCFIIWWRPSWITCPFSDNNIYVCRIELLFIRVINAYWLLMIFEALRAVRAWARARSARSIFVFCSCLRYLVLDSCE